METTEDDYDVTCFDCGRVEWWRGGQMILCDPPVKYDGYDGGPAEWTCSFCGCVVIRPSPMQEAMDRLPSRL